jgi:hypothetical protein
MKEDVWLARKIEAWYRSAYATIKEAGGYPEEVLETMPAELIITMARNDIHLVYKGDK